MNIDNGFDLLIYVVFSNSPQFGGLGTKSQEFVVSFFPGQGKTLSQFRLRDIHPQNENHPFKYDTGQKKTTCKYIMELSKFKHLQCYMTKFEPDYRKFKQLPQRHQLTTTFQFTIEEAFETLEITDIDM